MNDTSPDPQNRAIDAAVAEAKANSPADEAAGVVELVLDRWRLGKDDLGQRIMVPMSGPKLAVVLDNDTIREDIAAAFYSSTGKVPREASLINAVRVLRIMARDLDPEPVFTRIGYDKARTKIVVDLGDKDGNCVTIRPGRWTLGDLADQDLVFRRTSATQPLPIPKDGATPEDLDRIKEVLPFAKSSYDIVRSTLVVSIVPWLAHPILVVTGEPGSGKSKASQYVISVLDPQAGALQAPPNSDKDLIVSSMSSWVICFENMSGITDDMSDAICRLVTGGGIRNRALFTDDGLKIFEGRRIVIINGIDLGDLKGDFIDRSLPAVLNRISETDRRLEEELDAHFDEIQPLIVGALYETVAQAWARIGEVNLGAYPRMADAARWFAAVDLVFESGSLDLLRNAKQAMFVAVVEGDELSQALIQVVTAMGPGMSWRGTPSDLHRELKGELSDPPKWLSTPSVMGRHLRSIATPLREARILDIDFDREADGREIAISQLEGINAIPA